MVQRIRRWWQRGPHPFLLLALTVFGLPGVLASHHPWGCWDCGLFGLPYSPLVSFVVWVAITAYAFGRWTERRP